MVDGPALLFTCEHGGNLVPEEWTALFTGRDEELDSHAGYDPGALELARELAGAFHAPLVASEVTRLLVDLNRSPGHPRLFSHSVRSLPPHDRERILNAHYRPHREAVAGIVAANAARGVPTLHIAVHSFTPVLHGEVRRVDVGLLYDPARNGEKTFCARWQEALSGLDPTLAIRRNAPYKGIADGLPTWLRGLWPGGFYRGIELEVNQKFTLQQTQWAGVRRMLLSSLRAAVSQAG